MRSSENLLWRSAPSVWGRSRGVLGMSKVPAYRDCSTQPGLYSERTEKSRTMPETVTLIAALVILYSLFVVEFVLLLAAARFVAGALVG